jgi:signal transduction histidine kinase
MPASAFFYLNNHRTAPVKLWCLGGFLNGIALLMISIRPLMMAHLPDFFSFTLVNVFIVAGYSIRIQSLRIEVNRQLPNYVLIGLILCFGIVYQLCVSFGDTIQPRVLFALCVISFLLFRLAIAGKWYIDYFGLKRMGYISFFYATLGFTISVKVMLLLLGYESYDILQNSAINSVMTITGMLAVVYSNLGYIAVVLGKVEQDYQKSLNENIEISNVLEKRNASIKDLMRLQAFSTVGTYGATVVHEVLQPLTALRFGLENLETYIVKNNNDKDATERLLAVKKPAERAIGVIENLRNFMIERNIEVKPVLLNEVLETVVSLHQPRLLMLGVEISIQSTVMNGWVLADPHQLERVLFNIINNALDAINHASQADVRKKIIIKIQYIQQKQFVLIKVIDSGQGIAEGMESKIFEWMETHSGGMGIGMALSRMLVESWQGTISAYSANASLDGLSGAVFELKLRSAKI